ncbi:phosphatidylglycerol lysyltransferase domain-containing protein [Streptomyces youssoufiensis]
MRWPAQAHRRPFTGLIGGRTAGYVSYTPAYGSRAGWVHDLGRRQPDEVPGIMEAINKAAIESLRSEGAA